MLFLGLAIGAYGFAMTLQIGLNENFLVEDMGVSPFQKGLLEAARESCGIFALGILALLAGLAEPIIAAMMLAVFGMALAAYYGVHSFGMLVAMSVLWSQGLHVFMPLPSSMMLSLAEPGKTGLRLGQLQKAGAVGSAAGLLGALGLTLYSRHAGLAIPMRPLYLVAGTMAVLAGLACLGIPRDIKAPSTRLVFRRKYGLYYLLCFLEGWRKQIFLAFAGFLLVKRYGVPLEHILFMWLIVQAVGWTASPLVGRLIDRVGERRILIFYFSSLTLFFTGYAFIDNVYVLYALFTLDNSFFIFAMAMTTYVRKIAPPAEHTATLSAGVAANHVASVTMPLVGGYLWYKLGYQWPFFVGAAAAAASVLAAMRVGHHDPAEARSGNP